MAFERDSFFSEENHLLNGATFGDEPEDQPKKGSNLKCIVFSVLAGCCLVGGLTWAIVAMNADSPEESAKGDGKSSAIAKASEQAPNAGDHPVASTADRAKENAGTALVDGGSEAASKAPVAKNRAKKFLRAVVAAAVGAGVLSGTGVLAQNAIHATHAAKQCPESDAPKTVSHIAKQCPESDAPNMCYVSAAPQHPHNATQIRY